MQKKKKLIKKFTTAIDKFEKFSLNFSKLQSGSEIR